jgi:hypothetical protein
MDQRPGSILVQASWTARCCPKIYGFTGLNGSIARVQPVYAGEHAVHRVA